MTVKKKIISGIIVIIGLILFEIYSRPDYPPFFDKELEKYKADEVLIDSIGGYKSFEYEYNKNQLEYGPLDYQITIYGKTGQLVLKGRALKENNEWRIVKQATEIKDEK